jgi:hypothetical protein
MPSERHLARFVVEVIDGLDLSAVMKSYRGSGSEPQGHSHDRPHGYNAWLTVSITPLTPSPLTSGSLKSKLLQARLELSRFDQLLSPHRQQNGKALASPFAAAERTCVGGTGELRSAVYGIMRNFGWPTHVGYTWQNVAWMLLCAGHGTLAALTFLTGSCSKSCDADVECHGPRSIRG